MTDNATFRIRIVRIELDEEGRDMVHVLVSVKLTEESGDITDMSIRVPTPVSLDTTLGQLVEQTMQYVKRLLPVVEMH